MAAIGSLWDFEGFTSDAGPVDKDAGAAQATANGPAPNCRSSSSASLNGSIPAPNYAAQNNAEAENSPEAVLSNGQIRDVFQNERGITVRIDRARDDLLTKFGKSTLSDRYLMNRGCLGGSKGAAKG
jgi:ribonucleoside-diphosphate reductase alpha chain